MPARVELFHPHGRSLCGSLQASGARDRGCVAACATAFALLLAAIAGALAGSEGPEPVAVDVGHTWTRPGDEARGRSEFEFNRDLSVHVVDALHARGWAVSTINADGHASRVRARGRRPPARPERPSCSLHHDSVNAVEVAPVDLGGRAARLQRRVRRAFALRRATTPIRP